MIVKDRITTALAAALEQAREAGDVSLQSPPPIRLDVPPSRELGDYSSDLAAVIARQSRQPVGVIATALAARLQLPEGLVDRVDVAGAGFLNFHLRPGWLQEAVREARLLKAGFGRSADLGEGMRAQIEFVSADPTGPLTVNHGRGAALGDALAKVLEWNGFRVTREFYINDMGSQSDRFARALEARYRDALSGTNSAATVDAYLDETVSEVSGAILRKVGRELLELPLESRLAEIRRQGREHVLAAQQRSLATAGVNFDRWASETALHENGSIEEVLQLLRDGRHAYDSDGAVWLRSTRFGDDADRPLVRSNGKPTYLLADLAYHLTKIRQGFDRMIDIWGPEHASYVQRTHAGMQALGCDSRMLEILVFQPVSVRMDGILVDGPGANGNNLPLDSVLEKVGRDSARFFYLLRSPEWPLELDLDLAAEQSPRNPAYSFHTAHRRVEAALASSQGAASESNGDAAPISTEAMELMRKISEFPDEIRAAARNYDPCQLSRFALELAPAANAFLNYRTGAEQQPEERVAILEATQVVFANLRTVLGMTSIGKRDL